MLLQMVQIHLIPNSSWKDYSAANTNYAFDAFEIEEKVNSNGNQQLSRDQVDGGRDDGERHHSKKSGGNQARHGNGNPEQHHYREKIHAATLMPGGVYPYRNDTRSLQRPRSHAGPGAGGYYHPHERSTYSLPRQQSYHHNGPRHPHQQDVVQPDFYFMPSQRKYSGEVVRVYVDYNQ